MQLRKRFTGRQDHLPAIGELRAKALQRCSAASIAAAARTRVIADTMRCAVSLRSMMRRWWASGRGRWRRRNGRSDSFQRGGRSADLGSISRRPCQGVVSLPQLRPCWRHNTLARPFLLTSPSSAPFNCLLFPVVPPLAKSQHAGGGQK